MRGKVDIDSPDFSRSKDHPRLCGEKMLYFFQCPFDQGSPPPMRGKADAVRSVTPDTGITPAYAGKRLAYVPFGIPRKDHPRLCGEKVLAGIRRTIVVGSPPPMRGKEREELKKRKLVRITPAYAGKSITAPLYWWKE